MNLHARIAAILAASVLLCAFVVVGVGWRLRGEFKPLARDWLLGGGLQLVAEQLDAASEPERTRLLTSLGRSMTFPVALKEPDDVPSAARNSLEPQLLGPASEPGFLYVPLDKGATFLVVGPIDPPPPPPLGLIAVLLLVIIAAASVAVSWPLAQRIRRLREALTDIGRGQWAKRIDEDEGALADLAHAINYAVGELQTLFQEREALLQAVSHEMGTPLSRMRFQVELLETDATPSQRRRLSALCDDLDQLDELSSELVGWMEADNRRLKAGRFALAPAIESLLELESFESHQRTESLVKVPSDLFVVADQRQFLRAMENLLRNAMRYASRKVVVEARGGEGWVEIDVRDDGPGIPPAQRARVLEPFVRVQESRTRTEGGLGLGLSIVRRIVESHGGSIQVGEAPEGGAQITTRWPTAPAPRPDPTDSFEPLHVR